MLELPQIKPKKTIGQLLATLTLLQGKKAQSAHSKFLTSFKAVIPCDRFGQF
jgi:hypothetical protein